MHASQSGSVEEKAKNIMEKIPEFIANHLFLVSLLVAISSLLFWNIFFSAMGASQIVPAEVTRLINHEDAALLDVRSAEDFERGHIINAVNIDVATLGDREKKLDKYKDKTVVICCAQGPESIRVARSLKMKGFEKLYSLKGGISAWQNANLPLTKGKA
jgi:rhodanese-related sulfurtransferase